METVYNVNVNVICTLSYVFLWCWRFHVRQAFYWAISQPNTYNFCFYVNNSDLTLWFMYETSEERRVTAVPRHNKTALFLTCGLRYFCSGGNLRLASIPLHSILWKQNEKYWHYVKTVFFFLVLVIFNNGSKFPKLFYQESETLGGAVAIFDIHFYYRQHISFKQIQILRPSNQALWSLVIFVESFR